MDVLLENVSWMTYNVCLGIIGVVCGWFMLKLHHTVLRVLSGIFWILFIPNTIYILTDITHVTMQLVAINELLLKAILLIQYFLLLIFSIGTFVLGVYPFEKLILRKKHVDKKATAALLIFVMNFVIAFGVVVGRIQRTNSWEVFTNTPKVIVDVSNVLSSGDLLFLVLFFGLLGNILYFSLRKIIVRHIEPIIQSLLNIF